MNLIAAIAAISGLLRTLAQLLRQWTDAGTLKELDKLRAKGAAHDRLAKGVEARNRANADAGGTSGILPDGEADRWRRD